MSQMGEIAATTTFDDIGAHRLDATRRSFKNSHNPSVFASLSFDDRNLKPFAGKSTIDKDHTSVLTA